MDKSPRTRSGSSLKDQNSLGILSMDNLRGNVTVIPQCILN